MTAKPLYRISEEPDPQGVPWFSCWKLGKPVKVMGVVLHEPKYERLEISNGNFGAPLVYVPDHSTIYATFATWGEAHDYILRCVHAGESSEPHRVRPSYFDERGKPAHDYKEPL